MNRSSGEKRPSNSPHGELVNACDDPADVVGTNHRSDFAFGRMTRRNLPSFDVSRLSTAAEYSGYTMWASRRPSADHTGVPRLSGPCVSREAIPRVRSIT